MHAWCDAREIPLHLKFDQLLQVAEAVKPSVAKLLYTFSEIAYSAQRSA